MKNTTYIKQALLFLMLALTFSCNDNDDIINEIEVTETVLLTAADKLRDTLPVRTDAKDFYITIEYSGAGDQEVVQWLGDGTKEVGLTQKSDDGNDIIIIAQPNETSISRSATIIVAAFRAEDKRITVRQSPRNNLTVSDNITFEYNDKSEKSFRVETKDDSWEYEITAIPEGNRRWYILAQDSKELTATVQTNEDYPARSISIIFSAGDANPETRTLTQDGKPGLDVSEDLTFEAVGDGAGRFEISASSAEWAYDITDPADEDDVWFEHRKNGYYLEITVPDNDLPTERSAVIVFTKDGISVSRTITQEALTR